MNKFWIKYKEEKKLAKELKKRQENVRKIKERQKIALEKKIAKEKKKVQRKIKILSNKERTKGEKKARLLIWKKQTKKTKNISDSITKNKNKAYKYFQLYIRLLHADKDGYVTLACSNKRIFYTKCDAWHIYSKQRFPNIAFIEKNCRPISKWTNKMQWSSTGERRTNVLTEKEDKELEKFSQENIDRTVYTKQYYKDITEKYKKLCGDLKKTIAKQK